MVEAATHFADHVPRRHWQVVVEHLVRIDGVPPELLDLADRDVGGVEIGEEEGHPVGALGAVHQRRRARQQQNFGRLLRLRRPNLLAVDNEIVAIAPRKGGDGRGVRACVWLRYPERDVQPAGGGLREDAPAQFLAAMLHHRVQAKDREVQGGRAVHRRARGGDLFEQDRSLGDAEAGAPVFGWNRDSQPARVGEGLVEVPWKLVLLVAPPPIGVIEAGGERLRLDAHLLLLFSWFEVHEASPAPQRSVAAGQSSARAGAMASGARSNAGRPMRARSRWLAGKDRDAASVELFGVRLMLAPGKHIDFV